MRFLVLSQKTPHTALFQKGSPHRNMRFRVPSQKGSPHRTFSKRLPSSEQAISCSKWKRLPSSQFFKKAPLIRFRDYGPSSPVNKCRWALNLACALSLLLARLSQKKFWKPAKSFIVIIIFIIIVKKAPSSTKRKRYKKKRAALKKKRAAIQKKGQLHRKKGNYTEKGQLYSLLLLWGSG